MKKTLFVFSLFLVTSSTPLLSAASSSSSAPGTSDPASAKQRVHKRLERSASALPTSPKQLPRIERSHSALPSLPTQLNPIAATAARQGARKTMEDTFYNNNKKKFWGVYDGHGSHLAALSAQNNLHLNIFSCEKTLSTKQALKQGFLNTHAELKSSAILYGTTATVALVRSGKLYVANVGDSRAVLCAQGTAYQVSVDHKPDAEEEKARIESCDGYLETRISRSDFPFLQNIDEIISHKVQTVYMRKNMYNGLAVSRALGDTDLETIVSAKPYIHEQELNGSEDFLIIASDGLWDVMSNQAAVDLVKEWLSKECHPITCATFLVDKAITLWNHDNVTATIVILNPAIISKWTLAGGETTEDDGYSTEELESSLSE